MQTAIELREEARRLLRQADDMDHEAAVKGSFPVELEFVGDLRLDSDKQPNRRGLYKIDQVDTVHFVMWHPRLVALPDHRVRIRMNIELQE